MLACLTGIATGSAGVRASVEGDPRQMMSYSIKFSRGIACLVALICIGSAASLSSSEYYTPDLYSILLIRACYCLLLLSVARGYRLALHRESTLRMRAVAEAEAIA